MASAADHVDPGDETVTRVVWLGPDVGEIEVRVRVYESGQHDMTRVVGTHRGRCCFVRENVAFVTDREDAQSLLGLL
ncbi:MAG: hypothetical protein Phyf2KO_20810 [Phycisphaerales bacterium]